MPSTSAAFGSIGVLAAISDLRPREVPRLAHREAFLEPSSQVERPLSFWKRARVAHAHAAATTPCRRADSSSSTNSVRSTRCGWPSICSRHDGVGDRRAEVVRLDRCRAPCSRREQEARAHRDAGGAVRERGDEAAAVEEAAGARSRGRACDRVDDLRQQQAWWGPSRCGRRPRRPARSPRRRPTPRPSRRGAWRRSTAPRRTPASFSVLISRSRGAWAKLATFTLLVDQQARCGRRRRRRRRAGSRRTGWSVRAFTSRDRAPRAGRRSIVALARMPSAAGVRGRADEARRPRPSPCRSARSARRRRRGRRAACGDAGAASRVRALPARRGRSGR